jgi:hypothetical protein
MSKLLKTARFGRSLVRAAGQLVPRLVFGNCAGIGNNIVAQRELRRFQQSATGAVRDESLVPEAMQLATDGFLFFNPGYDENLLRDIQRRYREVIEDPNCSIGPRDGRRTYRTLKEPMRHIPRLRELINERVERMLHAHYGCYFRIGHVRSWRNYHVPGIAQTEEVFSNSWHTDQCPVTSLRLFVYLSDQVTRDSGAFRFHSYPDSREVVRNPGYLNRSLIVGRARKLVEDPSRVRYFEGKLGDACFCNVQLCLHRAGVPGPGADRDLAQFFILPSDRPLSAGWADELLPDPDIA